MAVYGKSRNAGSVAVLDFLVLGSSLSLRSYCAVGSSVAVCAAGAAT